MKTRKGYMNIIEKRVQKIQRKNFLNAIEVLKKPILESEFRELKNREPDDFIPGTREYIFCKAYGEICAANGRQLNFAEMYDYNNAHILATFGAIRASRQGLYEKLMLEYLDGYVKFDTHTYPAKNGGLCTGSDYDENRFHSGIKSLDFKHTTKPYVGWAKHWNETGGTQDSELSELFLLFEWVKESDYHLELMLSGSYFSESKIQEIVNAAIEYGIYDDKFDYYNFNEMQ